VLPLSTVLSSLVNFLLALPVFLVVALASGHRLTEALLLLPVVIVIQTVFSAGIAFFLATLNVYYRDTQFILELGMLALFFLTPIWYDLSTVTTSSNGVWLRRLNPMASIVNMYQDLMYKGVATNADFILRTAATATATSFTAQKPPADEGPAWWKPPSRLSAGRRIRRASRAASMVAPVASRIVSRSSSAGTSDGSTPKMAASDSGRESDSRCSGVWTRPSSSKVARRGVRKQRGPSIPDARSHQAAKSARRGSSPAETSMPESGSRKRGS